MYEARINKIYILKSISDMEKVGTALINSAWRKFKIIILIHDKF